MVLTKYFSLFGLSVSLSKNIFIFKCGCLSGSNNHNLHLEIAFFLKSRACHSPNHCGPLHDTKTSNFFHRVFHDATLKS